MNFHRTLLFVAFSGCLDPTEVDLSITTDVPCSAVTSTNIVVTKPGDTTTVAPTAVARTCQDGRLGDIMLVPSGASRASVTVRVVQGVSESPDACEQDGYKGGCIVARRRVSYLGHTRLSLPVDLHYDCLDVACDPTSTCVRGGCQPIDAPDTDAGPPPTPDVPGCDMRGLEKDAAWPMFGYCPSGRARSPFVGPHVRPRVVWSKDVASVPGSFVLIAADRTLYVSSAKGTLTAMYPDGTVRWIADLEGTTGLGAIAADGRIWVEAGSALDVVDHDGKRTTGYSASGLPRTPLVIAGNGNVLFANDQAQVVAVNGAGLAWQFGGADAGFTPVAPDGTVYFVSADGLAHALDANGKPAWPSPVSLPGVLHSDYPAIAPDGTLRFQSDDTQQVYSISAKGIAWASPSGTQPNNLAIADDGSTYFGVNGDLHGWDASGRPIWQAGQEPTGSGSPSIDAQGVLYYGRAGDTFLVAVDLSSHTTLWELDVGAAVTQPPSIGRDGVLYVASIDGKVLAIGP